MPGRIEPGAQAWLGKSPRFLLPSVRLDCNLMNDMERKLSASYELCVPRLTLLVQLYYMVCMLVSDMIPLNC